MDEDRTDLIARLCTAAGMIMEDMSAVAILMPGRDQPIKVQATLDTLATAVSDIAALIEAARVISRQA